MAQTARAAHRRGCTLCTVLFEWWSCTLPFPTNTTFSLTLWLQLLKVGLVGGKSIGFNDWWRATVPAAGIGGGPQLWLQGLVEGHSSGCRDWMEGHSSCCRDWMEGHSSVRWTCLLQVTKNLKSSQRGLVPFVPQKEKLKFIADRVNNTIESGQQ